MFGSACARFTRYFETLSADSHRNAGHDGTIAVINCQQLIDFCFDYIDGSLPQDERMRFAQHLGQCHDCVVFFETYRRTPELTREALATQIPAAVRDSVRNYLRSNRGTD
jgi:anti-sigma factor RsiW